MTGGGHLACALLAPLSVASEGEGGLLRFTRARAHTRILVGFGGFKFS